MNPEVLAQARAHILKQAPAIAGSFGHRQTYFVALLAVRHWALSDADAREILIEWNRNCQPPWEFRELMRKIDQAKKAVKSAAPIGCLADKASQRIGGGDGAFARWKAKRTVSDASDASRQVLIYREPIFFPIRKGIETSVRSVRNSQATGVNLEGAHNRGEQRQPLAQTRPPLIPLESPWRNGARYRDAGCTEIRNRLACYVEDEAGPWVRKHGVLIACTTSTPTTRANASDLPGGGYRKL